VRIHPDHDLTFGSLNADVHAGWSYPKHIIEDPDPGIALGELHDHLSRPIVAPPVYDH